MKGERTPYEIAAADLAAAAIELQRSRDEAKELRAQLSRAETRTSNAHSEWEKRRDALMKIIDDQGKA